MCLFGMMCEPEIKNGDIVFQESQSSQSKAISEGTNSPITHMGIVHLRNGKPYVFEAVSPHSKPLSSWSHPLQVVGQAWARKSSLGQASIRPGKSVIDKYTQEDARRWNSV